MTLLPRQAAVCGRELLSLLELCGQISELRESKSAISDRILIRNCQIALTISLTLRTYKRAIAGVGSHRETMEEIESLSCKRLDPKATLPTRGSPSSAGLDLYSIEAVSLQPKERRLIRTGLAVAIPEGHYGRLAPRSGLATQKGIDVLAGVIDADYRGEIGCLLYNTGEETIDLPAQTGICQLIIEKIITPDAVWVDSLGDTSRGSGGFGSTDAQDKGTTGKGW